jgi:lipoprotein-releasing system permease protein
VNALHYAFRVGLRYLRPKHRHFLLSLITVIATVGVMVAVAAPEVTLSVMNGFETEVRQRIVNTNYNVFVMSRGDFSGYKELQRQLEAHPGITAVSPFVRREGMVSFSGGGSLSQRFRPCVVQGIDPELEAKTTRVIQAIEPPFLGFNTDAFDRSIAATIPASSSASNWARNCT